MYLALLLKLLGGTMYELEGDPYPQRTECPFPNCPISVEEHHRVNYGLVRENGELRKQLKNSQPQVEAEFDLSQVDARLLLQELTRRL
jgi:hypothetical protein